MTVTPKAIPVPSSTTANAFGDTLKLTIGPTNAQVDLKQTAHGVSIKLNTNSGSDFGNVPTTGTGVTLPIQIANAGNQAAPVTLSVVADAQGDAGGGAFTVTGPDADSATPGSSPASVTFLPTDIVGYSAKIHLDIGAGVALCDALPTDVTFTGKGTDGVVSINPGGFTFGNASVGTTDCGTQAQTQVIHITNSSNKAFFIKSATLGKSLTYFSLTSGTTTGKDTFTNVNVPANTTVDLSIVPKLVPQSNATNPTAPEGFSDVLTIITDAQGDAPSHTIQLKQTVRGAYVVRSTSTALNLGTVPVGITSAPQTFTWQNVGNTDINLTQSMLSGAQYDLTPTALTLGTGAPPTTANITFTPTGTATFTDTITAVQKAGENTVLCQVLPANLGVTGAGGTAQLLANTSSSTSTISFGGITCGTDAPASKPLKIQNNGAAGTFTAKLRNAISPFKLSSTGGPIGAGEIVTIDVTPNPVGHDFGTIAAQSDVVDVTSDTASNAPAVTVTFTPQGAIIALSVKTLDFSNSTVINTTSAIKPITVTNNGNIPILLNYAAATTSPAAAPSVFTAATSSVTLNPGSANADLTGVTFKPVTAIAYEGAWTVSAAPDAPLCAPFPKGDTIMSGVIFLKGTGKP